MFTEPKNLQTRMHDLIASSVDGKTKRPNGSRAIAQTTA
jgi:hypothetical protein